MTDRPKDSDKPKLPRPSIEERVERLERIVDTQQVIIIHLSEQLRDEGAMDRPESDL
jgi:hypothetical protein